MATTRRATCTNPNPNPNPNPSPNPSPNPNPNQEVELSAPLSTQGSISLTVSWEVEEEWVDEREKEHWTRRGELDERSVAVAGAGGGAAKTEGPASAAKGKDPKGAAAPAVKANTDMASLSIAITILVKFVLFEMVGFFQVKLGLPSLADLACTHSIGFLSLRSPASTELVSEHDLIK